MLALVLVLCIHMHIQPTTFCEFIEVSPLMGNFTLSHIVAGTEVKKF